MKSREISGDIRELTGPIRVLLQSEAKRPIVAERAPLPGPAKQSSDSEILGDVRQERFREIPVARAGVD